MKYKVTLTGKTYEVEVDETQAMLVDEYEAFAPTPAAPQSAAAPIDAAQPAAAAQSTAIAAGEIIKAPMPGTILKVNYAQGATVKEGDVLIVLEAMKMENEILASRDGIVAQVIAATGSTVDTGTPLVVLS